MAPKHDPRVSNIPEQFTTKDSIVAALIADAYAALARAAGAPPTDDDEQAIEIRPDRVLRAQMMADLWMNAARAAQCRAPEQRINAPDEDPATVRG